MIKVKILNSAVGRNNPVFHAFHLIYYKLLHEYGIELLFPERDDLPSDLKKKSETSDYDYTIIGPEDFVDKSKSLEESTDWGLENLEKIIQLQQKTIDHDKKFGKYEMM